MVISLLLSAVLQQCEPDSKLPVGLKAAALRFKELAIKGDLKGLSQLCTPTVECFDVYRLVPSEMVYAQTDFFDTPYPKGKADRGYQVRRELIHPGKLTPWERRIIQSLCRHVKESTIIPGFISFGTDSPENHSLVPFSGLCMLGKIASNAYWRVDFELQKGKWVAAKFVMAVR